MSKTWFYLDRGRPLGPMAEADMIAMRRDGKIDEETLVWSPEGEGAEPRAWRPYSASGLQPSQESGGKLPPPPAPVSEISDFYLWLIVVTPVGLGLLDVFLFVFTGGKSDTAIAIVAAFVAYGLLAAFDTREVERSGHFAKAKKLNIWWMLLVPVYLWKRATLLKRGRRSVWIWLALVLFSAVFADDDFAEGVMAASGIMPVCDSGIVEDRVANYLQDAVSGHGLFSGDVSITSGSLISSDHARREICVLRASQTSGVETDVTVIVMRGESEFNVVVGDMKDVKQ